MQGQDRQGLGAERRDPCCEDGSGWGRKRGAMVCYWSCFARRAMRELVVDILHGLYPIYINTHIVALSDLCGISNPAPGRSRPRLCSEPAPLGTSAATQPSYLHGVTADLTALIWLNKTTASCRAPTGTALFTGRLLFCFTALWGVTLRVISAAFWRPFCKNCGRKNGLTLQKKKKKKAQIPGSATEKPLGVVKQTPGRLLSGCRAPGAGRISPSG